MISICKFGGRLLPLRLQRGGRAHLSVSLNDRLMSKRLNPLKLGFLVPLVLASACGGMTDQEKSMVGKYYIPALSDSRPMLELGPERHSVIRAIRPGELSYYVEGRWEVKDDSLVIVNDGASITIEDGDPSLVGTVAPRVAYPIVSFDERILRLERGGIQYDYHRRMD